MTAIAIPLVVELTRAVPASGAAPQLALRWSVIYTGSARGAVIKVSAGLSDWLLQPSAAGWLLFPPPPPREPTPLLLPEPLIAPIWSLLAAHDHAHEMGSSSQENDEVLRRMHTLVRAFAIRDSHLSALRTLLQGNAMVYTNPMRLAMDGLRALLTLPLRDLDESVLRGLLPIAGHAGEALLLEHARALGVPGALLIAWAAAVLTPDALLDAADWAATLPEAERSSAYAAIAPCLMQHAPHQDAAQHLLIHIGGESETAAAVREAAAHMPDALLSSWIDVAHTWSDRDQVRVMVALLPAQAQRGPQAVRQALAAVETIRPPFARAMALALILTHVTEIELILTTALALHQHFAALPEEDRDTLGQMLIVPLVTSRLAATAIDLACHATDRWRDELLERIVTTLLPGDAASALVAARAITAADRRAFALLCVTPQLTSTDQMIALDIAARAAYEVSDSATQAQLLLAVAEGLNQ